LIVKYLNHIHIQSGYNKMMIGLSKIAKRSEPTRSRKFSSRHHRRRRQWHERRHRSPHSRFFPTNMASLNAPYSEDTRGTLSPPNIIGAVHESAARAHGNRNRSSCFSRVNFGACARKIAYRSRSFTFSTTRLVLQLCQEVRTSTMFLQEPTKYILV